jgi:hypothetical protein
MMTKFKIAGKLFPLVLLVVPDKPFSDFNRHLLDVPSHPLIAILQPLVFGFQKLDSLFQFIFSLQHGFPSLTRMGS